MPTVDRKLILDYLVYLAVRVLVCILQCLTLESALGAARILARIIHALDRRHRQVALENLKIAYPELLDDDQRRAMALRTYEHFAQVAVEIAFIPRKLHTSNWKKYLTIDVDPRAIDAFLDPRANIVVTGHLGNWEMAGYLLAVIGLEPTSIARDLDNPFLHQFLLRLRSGSGQRIVSKKGDFDRIEETMKEHGSLVSVGDQSAGAKGHFVEFFGRPASTHKAIAILAREYDAPIVVGYALRDRPGFHYRVVCPPPIEPGEFDSAIALTQAFTTLLEEGVRQAPEQYLWLHRRWKHQPTHKQRRRQAA